MSKYSNDEPMRAISDEGLVIVSRSGSQYYRDPTFEIAELVSFDSQNCKLRMKLESGLEIEANFNRSPIEADGSFYRLEQQTPLKELSFQANIRLLEAMKSVKSVYSRHDGAAMFMVKEVNGDTVSARFIFPTEQPVTALDEALFNEECRSKLIDDNFISAGDSSYLEQVFDLDLKDSPLFGIDKEELSEGDIIIAAAIDGKVCEGKLLLKPHEKKGAYFITNVKNESGIRGLFEPFNEEFMGKTEDSLWAHFRIDGLPADAFIRPSDLKEIAYRAELKLQPDEALVLSLPCTESDGSTCQIILSDCGLLFYAYHEIIDHIQDDGVGPGLWVFEHANAWAYTSYEGEYDSGVDGNWRPAREDDIERFSCVREHLNDEIAEYLEDEKIPFDPEADLVTEWMNSASKHECSESPEVVM